MVLAASLAIRLDQRVGWLLIPFAERFFSGGPPPTALFPIIRRARAILETGFPLGGNAFLFHSTELRFPLIGETSAAYCFTISATSTTDVDDMSFRFRQKNITGFQIRGEFLRFWDPLPHSHRSHSRGFQPKPGFAAVLWILRDARPASGRHGRTGESDASTSSNSTSPWGRRSDANLASMLLLIPALAAARRRD